VRILRFALLNLGRNKVRSLLIGAIMAAGTSVVVLSAGLMETSSERLESAYAGGLTGDFAVLPAAGAGSGLFGDETPIVSDYAVMPALEGYRELDAALSGVDGIAERVPALGTQAVLQSEGFNSQVFAFGADARAYFRALRGLRLVSGALPGVDERWVLLNAAKWREANGALGRELSIGETLQLSVFSNTGFKLRPVRLAGVFEYEAPASGFEKVVLCDPTTARSLSGFTLGYSRTGAGEAPAGEATQKESPGGMSADDLDDLFSGAAPAGSGGPEAAGGEVSVVTDVEARLADSEAREELSLTDDSAWNYVILRAKDGASRSALRDAAREALAGLGTEYRLLGWRKAAGMSAQTVFILQAFLSGGLAFVMAGVALILMNSLFIAVIERTKEIGTMRALGARRSFVALEFAAEAGLLAVAAGLAGAVIGLMIMLAIRASGGIALENELLATLFGSRRLMPAIGPASAALAAGLVAAVAALSWIVPVRLASGIEPGRAMREE